MLPVIETERLVLKPLTLKNAGDIQCLAGDYDIYKSTLNVPHPYELPMAESWIETHERIFEENGMLTLGAFTKTDDCLIGAFSLGIAPNKHMGEIGYWIGKAYWNHGFASEASKALIDYGFANLGLNRVYGRYLEVNPASGRVMEKSGMTHEGTLSDVVTKDGTYHNVGYLGISRATWLRASSRAHLQLKMRRANKQDASALFYIQRSAFLEDIERYGDRPDCPANESLEKLISKIESQDYYVVEENGRIIGGANVRQTKENEMRLSRIYIDPLYHNLGIGKYFMNQLENAYTETVTWVLDTPNRNYRNQHFYESLGYVKVSENQLDAGLTLFDYQKL